MRLGRTVRAASAVVAAAGAVSVTEPAYANQYGPGNDPRLFFPDNGNHTFHYSNLSSPYHAAANWARVDSLDNGTAMTQQYLESPSGATDVFVFDEQLGGGASIGTYECISVTYWSSSHCETSDVIFNNDELDGYSADTKSHTACHEVGHSVGLDEEGSGCLQSGHLTELYFSDHSKWHVDDRFG